MAHLIVWSGFLGAWLLVAGPIYQAAIELEAETFERDAVELATAKIKPPPRTSPWWWLVPPVAYVRQRRRARAYRSAVMGAMPREQLEQMVRFANKATGWFFVAVGAFFIAVKETWELQEHYEWPAFVFWLLLVVLLVGCAVNTILRVRQNHAILDPDEE